MRKLEIGPGEWAECIQDSEWDTLTADKNQNATHHARWGYEPLPIADNSYDLVYASHVIEHIPWYQVVPALQEIHRILAPGGCFEVWTVDFAVVVQAYLDKKIPDQWRRFNKHGHYMTWVNGRIFAYHRKHESEELNYHRSCFDRLYLKQLLAQVGFYRTENLKTPRGADHGPINMGVAAWKLG